MAKTLHRLTAKQIEGAPAGACLNDGGGLFYRAARASGTGKWTFRFTSRDADFVARQEAKGSRIRQRDMGAGHFPKHVACERSQKGKQPARHRGRRT